MVPDEPLHVPWVEPDRPPARCGIPYGDLGASIQAVVGILAALLSRVTTGEGRMVDISMLDVMAALDVEIELKTKTPPTPSSPSPENT